MERTRLRKPSRSQDKHACPVDPVLLASAANSTPPEREHPIPQRQHLAKQNGKGNLLQRHLRAGTATVKATGNLRTATNPTIFWRWRRLPTWPTAKSPNCATATLNSCTGGDSQVSPPFTCHHSGGVFRCRSDTRAINSRREDRTAEFRQRSPGSVSCASGIG
jgi:hypothetical protein